MIHLWTTHNYKSTHTNIILLTEQNYCICPCTFNSYRKAMIIKSHNLNVTEIQKRGKCSSTKVQLWAEVTDSLAIIRMKSFRDKLHQKTGIYLIIFEFVSPLIHQVCTVGALHLQDWKLSGSLAVMLNTAAGNLPLTHVYIL